MSTGHRAAWQSNWINTISQGSQCPASAHAEAKTGPSDVDRDADPYAEVVLPAQLARGAGFLSAVQRASAPSSGSGEEEGDIHRRGRRVKEHFLAELQAQAVGVRWVFGVRNATHDCFLSCHRVRPAASRSSMLTMVEF